MRSVAEVTLQAPRAKRLDARKLPPPESTLLFDPRPKHVQHCQPGTGRREWWIWTWKRSQPTRRVRIPYSCNSWRCPACAGHEAHVLWTRIKQACEPLDPKGFLFAVLTLDQLGHYDKRPKRWRIWHDVKEAYRDLAKMQQSLMNRLRYFAKRRGWSPVGSKWVSVVEQHKSGWPHLNLMIYHPELAQLVGDSCRRREAEGLIGRRTILAEGEMGRMIYASGWGRESSVEQVRSVHALANYVTKCAGHSEANAEATANELAKITQAPKAAPPRFRRLRSGKGFLPKRQTGGDEWTGTLVRRQVLDGYPIVLPVHRGEEEFLRDVEQVCICEEDEWGREQQLLSRHRKLVERSGMQTVAGPAVTHWSGKTCLERAPPTAVDPAAGFVWRQASGP